MGLPRRFSKKKQVLTYERTSGIHLIGGLTATDESPVRIKKVRLSVNLKAFGHTCRAAYLSS